MEFQKNNPVGLVCKQIQRQIQSCVNQIKEIQHANPILPLPLLASSTFLAQQPRQTQRQEQASRRKQVEESTTESSNVSTQISSNDLETCLSQLRASQEQCLAYEEQLKDYQNQVEQQNLKLKEYETRISSLPSQFPNVANTTTTFSPQIMDSEIRSILNHKEEIRIHNEVEELRRVIEDQRRIIWDLQEEITKAADYIRWRTEPEETNTTESAEIESLNTEIDILRVTLEAKDKQLDDTIRLLNKNFIESIEKETISLDEAVTFQIQLLRELLKESENRYVSLQNLINRNA